MTTKAISKEITLTSFLTGVHTQQDVFNFVYRKLTEQGCGSVGEKDADDDFTCAYRGTDGAKCAVGWMIPDTEYKPEMDVSDDTGGYTGTGVFRLVKVFYPNLVDITDQEGQVFKNIEFLGDLQNKHDDAAYTTGKSFNRILKKNFLDSAKRYNLDKSVLDK